MLVLSLPMSGVHYRTLLFLLWPYHQTSTSFLLICVIYSTGFKISENGDVWSSSNRDRFRGSDRRWHLVDVRRHRCGKGKREACPRISNARNRFTLPFLRLRIQYIENVTQSSTSASLWKRRFQRWSCRLSVPASRERNARRSEECTCSVPDTMYHFIIVDCTWVGTPHRAIHFCIVQLH